MNDNRRDIHTEINVMRSGEMKVVNNNKLHIFRTAYAPSNAIQSNKQLTQTIEAMKVFNDNHWRLEPPENRNADHILFHMLPALNIYAKQTIDQNTSNKEHLAIIHKLVDNKNDHSTDITYQSVQDAIPALMNTPTIFEELSAISQTHQAALANCAIIEDLAIAALKITDTIDTSIESDKALIIKTLINITINDFKQDTLPYLNDSEHLELKDKDLHLYAQYIHSQKPTISIETAFSALDLLHKVSRIKLINHIIKTQTGMLGIESETQIITELFKHESLRDYTHAPKNINICVEETVSLLTKHFDLLKSVQIAIQQNIQQVKNQKREAVKTIKQSKEQAFNQWIESGYAPNTAHLDNKLIKKAGDLLPDLELIIGIEDVHADAYLTKMLKQNPDWNQDEINKIEESNMIMSIQGLMFSYNYTMLTLFIDINPYSKLSAALIMSENSASGITDTMLKYINANRNNIKQLIPKNNSSKSKKKKADKTKKQYLLTTPKKHHLLSTFTMHELVMNLNGNNATNNPNISLAAMAETFVLEPMIASGINLYQLLTTHKFDADTLNNLHETSTSEHMEFIVDSIKDLNKKQLTQSFTTFQEINTLIINALNNDKIKNEDIKNQMIIQNQKQNDKINELNNQIQELNSNHTINELETQISALKSTINQKSTEIKRLTKRQSEMNQQVHAVDKTMTQLNEMQEKYHVLETQYNKLLTDMDDLVFSNNDTDVDDSFDLDSFVNDLQDINVAIVGGHEAWRANVQHLLPNATIIIPEQHNKSVSSVRNADILVINTGTLNHSIYKRTRTEFEHNPNGKIIWINSQMSNMEKTFQTIYQQYLN